MRARDAGRTHLGRRNLSDGGEAERADERDLDGRHGLVLLDLLEARRAEKVGRALLHKRQVLDGLLGHAVVQRLAEAAHVLEVHLEVEPRLRRVREQLLAARGVVRVGARAGK
jgi:hypothetical protein